MTALVWLDDSDLTFPDIDTALKDPNGLLAVGGDLSAERLIEAYRHGIFPWNEEDQPLLWWSPDPRCVIEPASFSPSRSLARRMKKTDYLIRVDHDFRTVISHCQHRGGGESTWITPEMKAAYNYLHELGIAHSIECYMDDELAGGLYGLSIGPLFFGESMFHRKTDASKIAFAELMRLMTDQQCPLVDCQISNSHLLSLGAIEIPRAEFRQVLDTYISQPGINWQALAANL
jgi:leucyl/phenylalanyl-tRNA--protein transferase